MIIQWDKLCSFVDNKANKQWVWLALDGKTREIVGLDLGYRDEKAAKKLWNSLPPIGYANPTAFGWRIAKRDYRQCAVAYTDFWVAYRAVFPSQPHKAVGKADATPRLFKALGNAHQEETGKNSYIERFNNTLRPRISRLVRKTLSFSNDLENHIGAIWYFVHYYNASLLC